MIRNTRIQIVSASPPDAEGMLYVFHQCWRETYPSNSHHITVADIDHRFEEMRGEERLAERRKRIANPPDGHATLVAKVDGKVVGICRVINNSDENVLQALYVLSEYQGRGIGTQLWREAKKHLDPARPITVWAAAYNGRAIALYEKWGFVKTGETCLDENLRMRNGAIIPEIELLRKAERAP